MRSIYKLSLCAALALTIGACSSKKKTSDQDAEGAGSGTPSIDNTPLNFDAQGSDSGKIAGLSTVRFAYDQSTLNGEAKATIKKNAEWIKSKANVAVQIEGHCDARGSTEYNLSLGERRAQTVKNYLVSMGVPESKVTTISYGKEKPVASGDSEDAYAKNRRANFVPN